MTEYERRCVHMRYPKQTINIMIEQIRNSNEQFIFNCPLSTACSLTLALICHAPHKFIFIPSQKSKKKPFLEAFIKCDIICSHNVPSNVFFTGRGFACSIHGIIDLEIPARLMNQGNRIPIHPMPCNYRIWDSIHKPSTRPEQRSDYQFKVLSFNVLSEILLQHNFRTEYYENEEDAWILKSERIYKEVLLLDPDIICFQQVQVSHSEFYRRFRDIGYQGVFKKKTNQRVEGCAILFKHSRFELNDRVGVEYFQPRYPILESDSVGLLVKLKLRVCSRPIVIASTHLSKSKKQSSQEGYSGSRIAQLRILLHEMEKFVYEGKQRLPIILTGDFNSTRHSEAIKLLIEKHITIPIRDSLQDLGLKESFLQQLHTEDVYGLDAPPHQFKEVRQPFNFVSVYHMRRCELQQPDGWVAMDYMFFTPGSLKVVKRLRPPPVRVKKNELLNIYDDKMALAVVFEIKP